MDLERQLEAHHEAGYRWALACCSRDPTQAEDVLQTAYVKILEGRARYDGRAAFKTWLFSVIRKTAADARRRSVISRTRLGTLARHLAGAPAEDNPEEAIDHSASLARLREGVAALPGRQREVLHLVFDHELSLQEASRVMGVSLGTARAHYERGKKRLRQWMEAPEGQNAGQSRRRAVQGAVP